MVRALLAGTKTQTRREVKSPTGTFELNSTLSNPKQCWLNVTDSNEEAIRPLLCPYGQPGDRLWVRETWRILPDGSYTYGANYTEEEAAINKWKPSIFMPRWASRILLEIVSVRVERLQDISEADAVAEGIERVGEMLGLPAWKDYTCGTMLTSAVNSYHTLWKSINGTGSWQANPWVWVVEFKRIDSEGKEVAHAE